LCAPCKPRDHPIARIGVGDAAGGGARLTGALKLPNANAFPVVKEDLIIL
jgi:hypothetical protein